MLLGNLLKSASKKNKKISINGISFDSRKVKKRDVFFAIEGQKKSGTKFAQEALLNGASVIVSNKKIKNLNQNVPLVIVKDVRKS